MEYKDIFYCIGIVLTFIIAVFSIIINKRNIFINSVTFERVKWISDLRENISSFVGLTHHWIMSNDKEGQKSNEILKDIDKLRYLIKLQLNPEGKYDQEIIKCIETLPQVVYDLPKFREESQKLINNTQDLLKQEWEKVKKEARTLKQR